MAGSNVGASVAQLHASDQPTESFQCPCSAQAEKNLHLLEIVGFLKASICVLETSADLPKALEAIRHAANAPAAAPGAKRVAEAIAGFCMPEAPLAHLRASGPSGECCGKSAGGSSGGSCTANAAVGLKLDTCLRQVGTPRGLASTGTPPSSPRSSPHDGDRRCSAESECSVLLREPSSLLREPSTESLLEDSVVCHSTKIDSPRLLLSASSSTIGFRPVQIVPTSNDVTPRGISSRLDTACTSPRFGQMPAGWAAQPTPEPTCGAPAKVERGSSSQRSNTTYREAAPMAIFNAMPLRTTGSFQPPAVRPPSGGQFAGIRTPPFPLSRQASATVAEMAPERGRCIVRTSSVPFVTSSVPMLSDRGRTYSTQGAHTPVPWSLAPSGGMRLARNLDDHSPATLPLRGRTPAGATPRTQESW